MDEAKLKQALETIGNIPIYSELLLDGLPVPRIEKIYQGTFRQIYKEEYETLEELVNEKLAKK